MEEVVHYWNGKTGYTKCFLLPRLVKMPGLRQPKTTGDIQKVTCENCKRKMEER